MDDGRRLSIRSRLLYSFVALVVGPSLVIGGAAVLSSRRLGERGALDQLTSVLTLKAHEIDLWVDGLSRDLEFMARDRDVSEPALALLARKASARGNPGDSERLALGMAAMMKSLRIFSSSLVLDGAGRVVASSDPAFVGKDLGGEDYFLHGLQNRFVAPARAPGGSPRGLAIVAAAPLVTQELGSVGVLVGFSDLAFLDSIMAEPTGLGKTGKSFLVGADYTAIASPRSDLRGHDPALRTDEGARRAVDEKVRSHGDYLDFRGMPVFGAYTWLPELQVALVVEQDKAEAFASFRSITFLSLCVAALAVLLAIVAASRVTEGIAAPLSALAVTAGRISAGDLDQVAEVGGGDEVGRLGEAFNHMTGRLRASILELKEELAERTRAETRLRESEERNRTVLQTAMDGYWRVDFQGRILEVNEALCRMSGYREEELLAMRVSDLEAVERGEETAAHIREIVTRGFDRFESRHLRKDGSAYEVETSVQYKSEQGEYLFAFLRDITERKRAEGEIRSSLAEKEALLRELHHRTNNNMGIIVALLELQADEIGDESLRRSFDATTNRIRSMALVYQKLSESGDLSHVDLGSYLGDLVFHLVSSLPETGPRPSLALELEHPRVLIDTAIPCGLALNELVANSLTHAFPSGGSGRLRLGLRLLGDETIALRFADDGIGFSAGFDPRRDGRLGLQTVLNLGEGQLGGAVVFESGPGLACELRFRDDRYKARV